MLSSSTPRPSGSYGAPGLSGVADGSPSQVDDPSQVEGTSSERVPTSPALGAPGVMEGGSLGQGGPAQGATEGSAGIAAAALQQVAQLGLALDAVVPPAASSGRSSESLPPPAPPSPRITPGLAEGAESFAERVSEVSDSLLGMLGDGELSADRLLALFLILNITDPGNSVETHNMLHRVSSELRQEGLSASKKESQAAHEKAVEAMDKAEKLQMLADVLQVAAIGVAVVGAIISAVVIVVAIVAAIASCGAATPLSVGAGAAAVGGTVAVTGAVTGAASGLSAAGAGGASAAAAAAAQAAVQVVVQLVSQLAGQAAAQAVQVMLNTIVNLVIQAAAAAAEQAATLAVIQIITEVINTVIRLIQLFAEHEVVQAGFDAAKAENTAEKARHQADKLQDQVQEEAEIIKLLLEAKNQTISAVIRMAQAAASTQLKVMAAGASRG